MNNLEFDNWVQIEAYSQSRKRGNGWSGNQSVNADRANELGEHELSYFDKQKLVFKIQKINPNLDLKLLKKVQTGFLRSLLLSRASHHHVGKNFNYKVFYKINENAENLTNEDLLLVLKKQEEFKKQNKIEKAAKQAAPKKIKKRWAFVFGENDAKNESKYASFFKKIAQAENVDFEKLYEVFEKFADRITRELVVRGVKYPKSSEGIFKIFLSNFYMLEKNSFYYSKIKENVYSLFNDFQDEVNQILGEK